MADGDKVTDADGVLKEASAMIPLAVLAVPVGRSADDAADEGLDTGGRSPEDAGAEWAVGLVAGGPAAVDGLGVVIVLKDVSALYVVPV